MKPAETSDCPVEGTNQTVDKLLIGLNNISPFESEDGDNSLSERKANEPEPDTQLGHGNGSGTIDGLSNDDMPLTVSEIVERFMAQTRTRLKPNSQGQYARSFRRFATDVDLSKYSRRQLAGPKGRTLILQHLDHVPKPSWRITLASIRPVWIYGLRIAWPIDARVDLPKLPRTRQGATPPDSIVLKWKKALANETDEYLRLMWLLVAQHGWRPSHVCRLKWRNVQYDECGKPRAIVADGLTESFKTSSPIAARLTPDVAELLMAWEKKIGRQSSDSPILPWRSLTASEDLQPTRAQGTLQFRLHWIRLEEKWGLPHLRPKELRHWNASTARKSGLSKQASASMMGHDATQGGSMRDWYDSPRLEDIFAEQEDRLPNGPLGFLEPPIVEIEGGLPKEIIEIVTQYLNDELSTYDMGTGIEKVKNARRAMNNPKMTT
jgi:integrase